MAYAAQAPRAFSFPQGCKALKIYPPRDHIQENSKTAHDALIWHMLLKHHAHAAFGLPQSRKALRIYPPSESIQENSKMAHDAQVPRAQRLASSKVEKTRKSMSQANQINKPLKWHMLLKCRAHAAFCFRQSCKNTSNTIPQRAHSGEF